MKTITMLKCNSTRISVKKLPWVKDIYGGFITPTTKKFYIRKCLNMFKVEIDGAVHEEIFTLQEAQDYVQQLWDRSVLSLIKVEK